MITCRIRGRSLRQTVVQLRREWWTASFGSALFWTPLCLLNFLLVPQHSRVAFVAAFSFLHKTWLSWLSNRLVVPVPVSGDVPPAAAPGLAEAGRGPSSLSRVSVSLVSDPSLPAPQRWSRLAVYTLRALRSPRPPSLAAERHPGTRHSRAMCFISRRAQRTRWPWPLLYHIEVHSALYV